MTQSELTQEAQPTLAPSATVVPGQPYVPGAITPRGIPTYSQPLESAGGREL